MSTEDAEEVLAAFEARIDTVDDVVLIDKLEHSAVDTVNAHKGVVVNLLSTSVDEVYRRQNVARVTDTLSVLLSWQIAPGAQKSSRDDALEKGRAVRIALTALGWSRRTTYAGESHAVAKGWYLITQTYEYARDAQLGG